MSPPVRFEHLPAVITPGELAAISDATAAGWIIPPVYNCLRHGAPRAWRTAQIRYLDRRGLVGARRYRIDNILMVKLNAAGMAIKAELDAMLAPVLS